MNKKKWIIIAIVAVLVIGAVLAVVVSQSKRDKSEDEPEEIVKESKQEDTAIEISEDRLYDIDEMIITARESDESGVALYTAFDIKATGDVSAEILTKHLKVSVDKPYRIEKKEAEEDAYELVFDEPLEAGKVVSMIFEKAQEPFGFAFQTKKPLVVNGVYPSDGNDYTYTNTAIEVYFSLKIDEGIADYVHISPNIEGEIEVFDNIFRMIPSKELGSNTKYTITVDEGYVVGDETLSAFKSSFTTQYASYNSYGFYFTDHSIRYAPTTGNIGLSGYNNPYDIGETLELEVYSIEKDALFLELKDKSIVEARSLLSEIASQNMTGVVEEQGYGFSINIEAPMDLGYYYVILDDGQSRDSKMLQVTNYNAFTMADIDQVIVWVQNSQGLSNECKVDIDNGMSGITDSEGLAVLDMVLEMDETVDVVIETQEPLPLVMSMYVGSYEPLLSDKYYSVINTDRSVYLPSDDIHLSGFIKSKDGTDTKSVTINLKNQEVSIEERVLPLTDEGDFHTWFSYEDIYSYGLTLEISIDGEVLSSPWVSISQFEKPTYSHRTQLDKDVIMMGEGITLYGDVTYYEGTPLSEPTINVDTGWKTSFDGYSTSRDIMGDENGQYSEVFYPQYETTSWQPTRVYFNTSLTDIDTYYDHNYIYYKLVPRDIMVEVNTSKWQDGFKTIVDIHKIDMEKVISAYQEPETYKGAAVGEKEFDIRVMDHYYEAEYLGQVYDPVMKVFYDDYDYISIEEEIYSASYMTDGNGKIDIPIDVAEEGHGYEVVISTTDGYNNEIVVSANYGNAYSSFDTIEPGSMLYIDTEKYTYGSGEDIYLYLSSDLGRYTSDADDRMLIVVVEEGIEKVEVVTEASYHMTYPDNLLPSIKIYCKFYNGQSLYDGYGFESMLYFDKSERKAEVVINLEETTFAPAENVSGQVVVTDKDGKPLTGFVSLKVVDEAYYAIYEDYDEPLDELIPWYTRNNVLGTALASSYVTEGFYGAEGGAGGDEGVRGDFVNTAYADHLQLDDKGVCDFEFELPDNLTKWRITATAISDDIYAGKSVANVDATLPFSLTFLSTDRYNEKDAIYLTLKSASTVIDEGDVNYEIEVINNGAVVKSFELDKALNAYAYVPIGSLDAGDYEVVIKGELDGYVDGISRQIAVAKTNQHLQMTSYGSLEEDLVITHNDQYVGMSFMNALAYKRYSQLSALLYSSYEAQIYKVASYQTYLYMKSLELEVNEDFYGDHPFVTVASNNLYEPLLYNDEGDVPTTVEMLLMGYDADENINGGLKRALGSNELTYHHEAMAMYGLALLDEPMLLTVKEALANEAYYHDRMARLYLIKTLTHYGDYAAAKGYLQDMQPETDKERALLMMIYSDISDSNQANTLYEAIKDLPESEVIAIAEKFYYLTHLPTNSLDVSFEMAYGEHSEVISLDYNDVVTVTLTDEEAALCSFDKIDGEVMYLMNYIGSHLDVDEEDDLNVASSISGVNGTVEIGDIVTIEHVITAYEPIKSFNLNEIIPSGLVYVGNLSMDANALNTYSYSHNEGKEVNVHGYLYRENINADWPEITTINLKYTARATAVGTYILEPAIIYNNTTMSVSVGSEQNVEVLE